MSLQMTSDPSKPTLYQQVAGRIRSLIDGGTLRPGDRVPSVRRLSSQMSISISTVLEAYRVLEDERYIEARPQSGYYVRTPATIPPVPTKTRSDRVPLEPGADDLVVRVISDSQKPGIVPLGAAIPSAEYFPTVRLNRILARVVRDDPGTSQSYDSIAGHQGLRVQIARRLVEAGLSVTPDDIITSAGAQEAVLLCLRAVTKPGDTVAVETPTYFGLLEAIRSLHLRVLEIGTDADEGVCLEDLSEAIVRKRVAACVFVPNFGNPLGHKMPDDRKAELVSLLARHDVPLIEDDIYADLAFEGDRPVAAKSFDRADNVLLCSSFSKTLAPGYRVGWVVPGKYRPLVERLKFSTSVATATPTQMAVASYLESGGFDRHLRRLRRLYRDQVARVACTVGETFPEGTRVSRPLGGHILWVEMPQEIDSLEVYGRALEEGISVAPGPLFSAADKYRNFLRLNCALPWSDETEDAIARLGRLVSAIALR
ncbi:MAG: PLP-dependent aminotransferase family protein [Candidatus Eisenbacteria bacterium]|uniref:PLP-dependent aminotransferase family protein n=1 Tax=Eiseniibacteriota bacterium TaxID=2212470 RepID=A0A956LVL5_UNCEI|nr:PLP-dependent aminotransferase family protein [Candidatus Eisenbacteria bacterium]